VQGVHEPTEASKEFERELGEWGPVELNKAMEAEVEKMWKLRTRAQAPVSATDV